MEEPFPYNLCAERSKTSLAFPIVVLLCASILFYNLFFGISHAPSKLVHDPHRTAFHFQPINNWMNDPNGPMFYKGYYHLFYQWNPFAAVWGNITWGHAVSEDLVHWYHLYETALKPDQWYDMYGCWTGSATLLGNTKPVLVYTGWSNVSSFTSDHKVQMQSMAIPADYGDPLLRKWTKIPHNPIVTAPPGIDANMFRDPTTAWMGVDGKWRMVIGSQMNGSGVALLYHSMDFVRWEIAHTPLYSIMGSGMWECPDFYPVPLGGNHGVETSESGQNVMHVLKMGYNLHDYYTVGTYSWSNDTFTPQHNHALLRYDYGKYYASKSFFDPQKGRRIIVSWVNESDTKEDDVTKGWASLQAIPRSVWLNPETNYSLLQWPIEEIENLRRNKISLQNSLLEAGSVVKIKGINGAQLDVDLVFRLPELNRAENIDVNDGNAQQICSKKGLTRRGALGPFGLLVLASSDLMEQTAIFFYIVSWNGEWRTLVCSDQSRSSLDMDLDKTIYGGFLSLQRNQSSLHLRTLVDHSIVETYAEGGKVCITSRVYPTRAIDEDAFLFVFNNGTAPIQLQELVAWRMDAIEIDIIY